MADRRVWAGKALRVVLAGLAAALAFALFSMLWFAIAGGGFWKPLNLIAHTVWRQAPIDGGFHAGAAVLGAVTLAVVAIIAITPFAVVAIGTGMRGLFLILGAGIYANAIWVFGHYLLWEALDPVAASRFSPGVAWLAHFVAGVAAGLALLGAPLPDQPVTRSRGERERGTRAQRV